MKEQATDGKARGDAWAFRWATGEPSLWTVTLYVIAGEFLVAKNFMAVVNDFGDLVEVGS